MGAQPRDERDPAVVTIQDDRAALIPFDDWLAVVAGDEPVTLPQPAARFLDEAREAGEV